VKLREVLAVAAAMDTAVRLARGEEVPDEPDAPPLAA
jgi:hypothetical protein